MRFISLTLQDFQAHEHTVVEFGPDISVVVGATDVGKSAVLRALRWVCQNDIAGDEFIRHGAKQAVVALKIKTGKEVHEIVRIRGKGENSYKLDGKEYSSFGNTVPADIATLLNLNAINFQNQHDSPYWFSETAGEVSRQLNAIIDLDVIDTALSNVASEVRKSQERKEVSEERLKEIKNEYDDLAPQKDRIGHFQKLVAQQERTTEYKEDCDKLLRLGTRIRDGKEFIKNASERAADGNSVLSLCEAVRKSNTGWKALKKLSEDIQHYRAASEPPPDFTLVSKAFEKWKQLAINFLDLEEFIERGEKGIKRWKDVQLNSYNAEKAFERKTKNALCPICLKPLP